MEVWLAHRALGTVGVRLARQCDSALALANQLVASLGAASVWYPGLAAHPDATVVSKQMRRAGCVLSFDVGSKDRATRFLASLTLVREATSFGGIHSTAERRARWGGDAVPEGFIRFSCGIEATDDLLEDVRQALARAS
jgi:cystathionine gamma-lyase